MKKLIILSILTIGIHADQILGMDKEEFQAKTINSILDGFKGTINNAANLITNPPDLKKQREKEKKKSEERYKTMYRNMKKSYWKIRHDMEKSYTALRLMKNKQIKHYQETNEKQRKEIIKLKKLLDIHGINYKHAVIDTTTRKKKSKMIIEITDK